MSRTIRLRLVALMLCLVAIPVAAKDGDSKFATLNGAKIHYQSYGGEGKDAFVLVHGWSSNLEAWGHQIPDLAKRARVIALDLPGHARRGGGFLACDDSGGAPAARLVLFAPRAPRSAVIRPSLRS